MLDFKITEYKDTRSGFGDGLLEAGKADENVVALCADLTGSLKMNDFQNSFPEFPLLKDKLQESLNYRKKSVIKQSI